jgi:autotransporter adhesin
MLRRVRSSSVVLRSSGLTVGGSGSCGVGKGRGDSGTGSKDVVRDMVMRVRSMRDMDMRGWAFLTGEGVALATALAICSARASSGSSSGGSK